MEPRYAPADLIEFSTALFNKAGLSLDRARVMSEMLVEGDLLGHTTHGLQLAGPYLKSLAAGDMTKEGDPEVIQDRGSVVTWDGKYLPGPWLVVQAMNLCFDRIKDHPVMTVSIQHSHHIAALGAFLHLATDKGYMILLSCSDPYTGGVAPYGAKSAVYTPDPLAAGWPTDGDPVLIDISMSITAIGKVMRTGKQGDKMPGQWLVDHAGAATDDPNAFLEEPKGALLPLGGMDAGYKGFGLGLLVEALTSGLGGRGRAEAAETGQEKWAASVFLQIIDPDAFGGLAPFRKETGFLAQACRQATPIDPANPVRIPGQAGLARKREALESGVALEPMIMPSLVKWAEKLGVTPPEPIS